MLFQSPTLTCTLGIKPLSAFGGVVNKLHAERLQKMFEEEYPGMILEQQTSKSERGLLAFLRDNVIDMDPAPGERSILLPSAHELELADIEQSRRASLSNHMSSELYDATVFKGVRYPRDKLHIADLDYGRGRRQQSMEG